MEFDWWPVTIQGACWRGSMRIDFLGVGAGGALAHRLLLRLFPTFLLVCVVAWTHALRPAHVCVLPLDPEGGYPVRSPPVATRPARGAAMACAPCVSRWGGKMESDRVIGLPGWGWRWNLLWFSLVGSWFAEGSWASLCTQVHFSVTVCVSLSLYIYIMNEASTSIKMKYNLFVQICNETHPMSN
jgi:hypothetical protein